MAKITRLPAMPLAVSDPYFSIWSAADRPTDCDTTHWTGAEKPLRAAISVDGRRMRLLGLGGDAPMTLVGAEVTATKTKFSYEDAGVRATLSFTTPLLLHDPDALSAGATYVEISAESMDGAAHAVECSFHASSRLCYDGSTAPAMAFDAYEMDGLFVASVGQRRQKPLSHSGDHITIDWGYLYLAARAEIRADENGVFAKAKDALSLVLAYDDIASINYFGRLTPAWYARGGKTIVQMIAEMDARREEYVARCADLDADVFARAEKLGGADYALVCAAAYRQSVGAHKLIADERGEMVFLSKENDSNGCIGTVDVSYPSIPLYLLYAPEYVRAMCRPILKFANLPVWKYDFAPHDVGRYPHATGQVYAGTARRAVQNGETHPDYYLYPASKDAYDFKYQMPVEECGNMLLMLAAAGRADGNWALAEEYLPTLEKWVKYLIDFGEDPGEQLCTDDFAGHLARNINLSAKAVCGVAGYGMILRALGRADEGAQYLERAKAMAESWLSRADAGDHTHLTFDGAGWSMKYNMVWDRLFGLGLLPASFYGKERAWHLSHMNRYGLPLDSRADYTKSDWLMWVAAMAAPDEIAAYVKPLADFLRETPSRVPFSDWYDTKTGQPQHFVARSVQGGVFMPLLMERAGE